MLMEPTFVRLQLLGWLSMGYDYIVSLIKIQQMCMETRRLGEHIVEISVFHFYLIVVVHVEVNTVGYFSHVRRVDKLDILLQLFELWHRLLHCICFFAHIYSYCCSCLLALYYTIVTATKNLRYLENNVGKSPLELSRILYISSPVTRNFCKVSNAI